MKRIFFAMVFIFAGYFTGMQAQVTIGSDATPNSDAVLDLISNSNRGLLLPRVALTATNNPSPLSAHVKGMTVYNTAVTTTGSGYDVKEGIYYNDGTKWVTVPNNSGSWFYMPSIAINTSVTATGKTLDLYSLYKSQFSAPPVKSTSAPSAIPYLPNAGDLYYYITDYDASIFSNMSIDDNGVFHYDVTAAATECSYINIVFVVK